MKIMNIVVLLTIKCYSKVKTTFHFIYILSTFIMPYILKSLEKEDLMINLSNIVVFTEFYTHYFEIYKKN